MATSKKKKEPKIPLTERTDNRGLFELTFPAIGSNVHVVMPATNRSIMLIFIVGIIALAFMLPSMCYIVFAQARVENVESFGDLFRRGDKDDHEPTKVPVQTEDGVEMIEVCPPCPVCEETFEPCICPTCPTCPMLKTEPIPDADLE